MRRLFVTAGLLFSLILSTYAFGQSGNATVSGTIEDSSRAVLPGVTVTATNTATGIVTTVVTNESGAYNIPGLITGPYKMTAELPGFQTRTYDVQLGNNQQLRLNFTLSVGTVGTAVDVTVAVDTLLATSSSSVGEVLSQQKVQDLPMVGNNVLSLIDTMVGVRMNADGVNGTFAGMDTNNVNVLRDGIDSSASARFKQAGIQTATLMSPDLVGEVRLILAPVDAEMGRGNGQMQVFTRSGTNRFTGSAAWFIRNSALDANTWTNNRAVNSITGQWSPVRADWVNRNQYTASLGGPIVKNKTFFFALFDGLIVNQRTTQNPTVLTPCARNGIFRYYDNWNNGNALQVTQATGTTPTIAVVDGTGAPLRPANNPQGAPLNGSPFTGTLRYASVFGPLANIPTRPDCSDAVVQGAPWDTFRTRQDPTGFIKKVMDVMPMPNNYEVGDGLNTAGYRWLRSVPGGTESIFGITADGIGRKQLNTKIDHNFNGRHKIAGTYTYERNGGPANLMTWPDTFQGSVFRRPQHMSSTLTSTLSPSIVNEARFGFRRIGGNTFHIFNDPDYGEAATAFYPNYNSIPTYISAGTGAVSFPAPGGSTSTYRDITTLSTYGDSLSWTKSTHAFKFGGELRLQNSWAKDAGVGTTALPRVIGGDLTSSPISVAAISATNMPGLAGTNTTGNNVRMRNLLSFLAGSVGSITQAYYMQDPSKLDAFEDYRTFPERIRDFHANEFSMFFKDDWKVHRNLTLNMGVRWDYYGSPYEANGFMPLPIGGGFASLGYSGRSFNEWMSPGKRGDNTVFEYVGKNSPNPDTTYLANDYNNFGPAVGFAWQLPWLGAGKTTIRGGYQVTYQIGESFNNLQQEVIVPGSSYNANYTGDSGANAYVDLTKLPSLIPVPIGTKPMQPIPVTERSQGFYVPDPNIVTPYAQNLTLSLTRSIGSKVTLDLRYLGTLARKQRSATNNINVSNFRSNGLLQAFDAVRRGDESPLLDDIFKGINLAGGAGFGAVGSTVNGVLQTAGMHLRQSTNTRSNLANGNYVALANTLNTLNYTTALNPGLPPIPALVNGAVLRQNGYPENFIVANPQFGAINFITNNASNNYHSLNAQVTVRPANGITSQSTYSWSRNLGVALSGGLGATFTDPLNRAADYGILPDTRVHDFRTNGIFTLPFGPSQLLFGNSSGLVARLIEGWQLSWIVNVNSGAPLDITAQNMLYANGRPDIVGPFDLRGGKAEFLGGPSGQYFDPTAFVQVPDPQCARVTARETLGSACTLTAMADARTGQILLQNPLPGLQGTLGRGAVYGPGRWRFDAAMSKEFKLTESKRLQFRVDARNVLNHPEPNNPSLSITAPNFGIINAKSNLHRELQGQLRLSF
jgi:hypothetical protein